MRGSPRQTLRVQSGLPRVASRISSSLPSLGPTSLSGKEYKQDPVPIYFWAPQKCFNFNLLKSEEIRCNKNEDLIWNPAWILFIIIQCSCRL